MAEALVVARAKQTVLRRAFTISIKSVELALAEKPFNREVADVELAKLTDKAERLFLLDSEIEEALLTEGKLDAFEEIESELEVVEKYREEWIAVRAKRECLRECHTQVLAADVSDNSSAYSRLKLNLPKLNVRRFDIKPRTWIAFWAAFRKIHERENLDPEDKFQLLIGVAQEGTAGRELLDAFPPSAANYERAVAQLKQRFGRDKLIVELYVRELLGLVVGQAKGDVASSVRQLCDSLEAKLMALESLGLSTNQFACVLLPLVESSLPERILREWERARSASENALTDATVQMEQLRLFLKKEVAGEERVALARSPLYITKPAWENRKMEKSVAIGQKVSTAAGLVSMDEAGERRQQCVFCTLAHPSEFCHKAKNMEHESKIHILKQEKRCFRCLKPFHGARHCKGSVRCLVCSRSHVTIMCRGEDKRDSYVTKTTAAQPEVENSLSNTSRAHVLMQTLQVRVNSLNGQRTARLLFDTGSQRSYITKRLATELEYSPTREEKVVHALFGGTTTDVVTHQCYKARLQNLASTYMCNFDVLESEQICHAVPVVPQGPWMKELQEKGIQVSDTSEGPVDVLVGSDVVGKLFTGRKEVLSCGLVAMETELGWVVMGRIRNGESNYMANVTSLCSVDLSPGELWDLDVIGIRDLTNTTTAEEAKTAAREHFNNTVKTLEDGRYEVCLPWMSGHSPLPRRFSQAASRLESTIRRLCTNGLLSEYDKVFNEWLQEGVLEEVPIENWDVGHYLPHRAVVKEGSTTRVRPVFDASAHEKGRPNLNQCLEKGDNLIELIPSMLLRFRLKKIGLVADIRRAFLQIAVCDSDRDFLRFLWTDGKGGLKIFRHKRVVFGVTSSPYLLGAVIDHHLNRCRGEAAAESDTGTVGVIDQLKKSLYVDNCITSLDEHKQRENFMESAKTAFLKARFDLRGWEWSDSSLKGSAVTSVVGVAWDRQKDTLKVKPPDLSNLEKDVTTRRSVLSASQKLFDPIGVCSPTSLVPRLIIQDSWRNGGNWDTPLCEKTREQFKKWASEVAELRNMEIPRWIYGTALPCEVSLHVFCDASQHAYAVVTYLGVETDGEVAVTLVAAKSRVAPLKRITIPRLELLAATIGARLAAFIQKDIGTVRTYFWSDSTTVLSWIRREELWGVFVGNRIKEIRSLTKVEDWRHVPGVMNPADLASRGCNPHTLLQARWWEGPTWLRSSPSEWPSVEAIPIEEEVLEETRKAPMVTTLAQTVQFNTSEFDRLSSYSKTLRVAAWCCRFIFNKFSKKPPTRGELTVAEIVRAETLILRMVQDESFGDGQRKSLKKLKPTVDTNGLIRLRTKIWARNDSMDFRSPIILPGNHELVKKLVMEMHKRNGHIVGQNLLNMLRERFWLLRGRHTIKRVIAECSTCQRQSAKAFEVESPPLPENRVRDANIFEISGVDLAGPLYLADGSKVWIVLFTCAIYRAIHLELVASQTTEAFMMAFTRFIALRGRPSVMYSDNGLNFRGTANKLEGLDWNRIASEGAEHRIEWRFSPPRAAWWGGFWERMVSSVKVVLRKVILKNCPR